MKAHKKNLKKKKNFKKSKIHKKNLKQKFKNWKQKDKISKFV